MAKESEISNSPKTVKEIKREIQENIKSGKPGNNIGPLYTSILLESIFTHCENQPGPQTIRIVTNQLNGEVYSRRDYIKAMMSFVKKKNTKLLIITDKIPPRQNKLNAFEVLHVFLRHEEYHKHVKIYEVNRSSSFQFNQELATVCSPLIKNTPKVKDFHFAISTCGAYRLEFNSDSYLAEYSFNKQNDLKAFEKWFDGTIQQGHLVTPYVLREHATYPKQYDIAPV